MHGKKFWWMFGLMAACLCGVARAQDVQPQIPDYARRTTTTTTTTTSTTTTKSPSANAVEPEATTTPAPLDTTELIASTRPTYTTEAPSTETTTTITTTARPNSTTPWHVLPTAYPWHPAPQDPYEPSAPDYWPHSCYYKQQRGTPQLQWLCGQLRWVNTLECYRCCYYEFSSFAGCYRVYSNYCGNEVK